MCDIDEPSALYSRRPRRARQSYVCEACGEPIPAGMQYVAHSGLDDGSFWTIRQCTRCDAITSAIQNRWDGPVDLYLGCGEDWLGVFGRGDARWTARTYGIGALVEDVELHMSTEVQALAFMLPGESP